MSGSKADALALEANAEFARLAFSCAYSSSDEYEAELIKARREAGVYGPRRQQRQAYAALGIAAVALVAFLLIARF
jgi:hypothetical protein